MTSSSAIVPTATTAADDVSSLHVLFKVGGADYALPASVVLQMEAYTGATAVPGTKPFVAGVVQLRGRVVAVVDLRKRFGLPPADTTLETRVVVGEHEGRAVALVADSAREVARIAPSQIKPPPRLVDDGQDGFVRGVAQIGDRTVLVLDFPRVIDAESTPALASAPSSRSGEEPVDV